MNRLSSEPIHHGRHLVKGLPPAMRSGRRKSARERRVPLRSKRLCFFSLLTETLWTGRAFGTVSSLAFLEPPHKKKNFKADRRLCLRDAAVALQNAATEKCDVGQMVKSGLDGPCYHLMLTRMSLGTGFRNPTNEMFSVSWNKHMALSFFI